MLLPAVVCCRLGSVGPEVGADHLQRAKERRKVPHPFLTFLKMLPSLNLHPPSVSRADDAFGKHHCPSASLSTMWAGTRSRLAGHHSRTGAYWGEWAEGRQARVLPQARAPSSRADKWVGLVAAMCFCEGKYLLFKKGVSRFTILFYELIVSKSFDFYRIYS